MSILLWHSPSRQRAVIIPAEKLIMTEATKDVSIVTKITNGVKKQFGFDSAAFADNTERLAGGTACALIGVMAYSRLAVRPALKELPNAQKAAVIERMPLGKVTVGSL